jgi:uncharacterized protein
MASCRTASKSALAMRPADDNFFQPIAEFGLVTLQQEIEAWRSKRLERLTAADGWLSLVGLYWLEPGDNRFGRSADNDIAMDYPGVPERLGVFSLHSGKITFQADPGAGITHAGEPVTTLALTPESRGDPTILRLGTLSFYVIESAGRFALRIKDSAAQARAHFLGLQYFDIGPDWCFEAHFETYSPMKKIPIVNVFGMEEEMDSPGALVFDIGGQPYRLDTVLERGETDYFVMFADRTNGKQTYGAGRFLYVHPPVDGSTVLDFNKAYNPPCVFSSFATCPLPPPQNRLPIEVRAGELQYPGSSH